MNSPLRILVVDDHDILRRGLTAYFGRLTACRVTGEARTAEDALASLAKQPVDLVVMDLHLPGEDGISATTRIKAAWPETKVLVLSGKSAPEPTGGDVERAVVAGADGYVAKQDGESCLAAAIEAFRIGQNYLSPSAATEMIRVRRAAETASATDSASPITPLTAQENAVLKRMAEGASYKDIAAELGISVKTVDTYRTRLTRRLGLSTREEVVRYAIKQGLVRIG